MVDIPVGDMPEISELPVKTFDLNSAVTCPALSVNVTLTVTPPTGLIVVTQGTIEPVEFSGPSETKDIPVQGPSLHLRLLQGATDCEVRVNHWSDANYRYHRTRNKGFLCCTPLRDLQ
jgi:hypothetical protein